MYNAGYYLLAFVRYVIHFCIRYIRFLNKTRDLSLFLTANNLFYVRLQTLLFTKNKNFTSKYLKS